MKKILLTSMVMFGFGVFAFSQVNPNALGLRLGGGTINGGELSYQKGIGSSNRLELDLGFGGNKDYGSLSLTGIYHWNWNIVESLNWYVGPGAGVSFVNAKHGDNYVGVAIGGQIGLEYDFSSLGAPILLSLDARPMWNLLGDFNGFGWGAALGIRYIF